MLVAAISLAGLKLGSIKDYCSDLSALIRKSGAKLVVLPAYSSLVLGLTTGALQPSRDYNAFIQQLRGACSDWNRQFLDLHSTMARELNLYLAAGTLIETELDHHFHTAFCFNPAGAVCCRQRQTHLARDERMVGLSRGGELSLFPINDLQVGMVVGNDARHPEVGRIFALLGADLLLHSGALREGFNCWAQAAGMWSQVQQNQVWAVEAQLNGIIAGRSFAASSAVIGPCEITSGQSGYLARGYPESPVITAELNNQDLLKIRKNYPLLKLLNPAAYSDLING